MNEQPWHRRHAVQLAAQLPENGEDALIVLRAATRLVTGYLAEPEPTQKPAPVVALVGGQRDRRHLEST
jgi:hypothetical protein